jgi:hypothetical protein
MMALRVIGAGRAPDLVMRVVDGRPVVVPPADIGQTSGQNQISQQPK